MKLKIFQVLVSTIAMLPSVAQNKIPLPSTISEINYYARSSNTLQSLEKGRASLVTKAKALGYGGSTTNFELPGNKSSFRIAASDSTLFIVTLGDGMGEPSAWFNLFAVTIKKGKRIGNWVNSKAFAGKNSTGNIVAFNSRKISGNSFEIILPPGLEKGEYMFVNKGTMATYGGQAADSFAFGID